MSYFELSMIRIALHTVFWDLKIWICMEALFLYMIWPPSCIRKKLDSHFWTNISDELKYIFSWLACLKRRANFLFKSEIKISKNGLISYFMQFIVCSCFHKKILNMYAWVVWILKRNAGNFSCAFYFINYCSYIFWWLYT